MTPTASGPRPVTMTFRSKGGQTVNIEAPQTIWIILMTITLWEGVSKHGQPETGTHSAWVNLLAVAISVGLLYWGGFFG